MKLFFFFLAQAIIMPKSSIPQGIQIQSKTLKTTMYGYNLKSYPTSKMPMYFVIFKFFNTCIFIAQGE
jgi:hypothetical protein